MTSESKIHAQPYSLELVMRISYSRFTLSLTKRQARDILKVADWTNVKDSHGAEPDAEDIRVALGDHIHRMKHDDMFVLVGRKWRKLTPYQAWGQAEAWSHSDLVDDMANLRRLSWITAHEVLGWPEIEANHMT